MSNNPQAVVAVKEEHVIIDGVWLKKTTAVVATEQGLVRWHWKCSLSFDVTSSDVKMDQFTAIKSGFPFKPCEVDFVYSWKRWFFR